MKTCCLLFVPLLFWSWVTAQAFTEIQVTGVSNPVLSLNGTWKICLSPPPEFWRENQSGGDWHDIQVPGEAMMQGFPIRHDQPFVYLKTFEIPADYQGKIIKLRFEGVYSQARVWVNGHYLRDHSGGFTAWDCDITSVVKPGTRATLIVAVTDKADEISYASGYAKHPIGGILRNVSLLALPVNYPTRVIITTDLDQNYQDALLSVEGQTSQVGKNSQMHLELFDSSNQALVLEQTSVPVTEATFRAQNRIANPQKWDAEHPNLYLLKLTLVENGQTTWIRHYRFGFREIEIRGNRFLLNGQQVKLRGACRHDLQPLLGRVSTPEYELMDVRLAKEANINFIRTSHYPPTENLLHLCDAYGIYVEDETAVCFVGTHRMPDYQPGATENAPEYTDNYLSQLQEMVLNHGNHPCVLFWSIGNENAFGLNFKKSYDWVKQADPTRPVIFSYPGQVPDSVRCYDLISMHYPGITGTMEQYGLRTSAFGHPDLPVIFDEWAHVACYNQFTVKEDPNVRDFWGIGLDSMWQRTYDADGGLGGAIWGMIDETFMLPIDLPGYNDWWGRSYKNQIPGEFAGPTVGYGEWGIIDAWRRKKPEFWNVKKAYSPVRILQTIFEDYRPGTPLVMPVYNRFDFTNLNEVTIRYTYQGITTELTSPDIPAHSQGLLQLPLKEWSERAPITIDFYDRTDQMIDTYTLRRSAIRPTALPTIKTGKVALFQDSLHYILKLDHQRALRINKATGLFNGLSSVDREITFSGPLLNFRTRGKELAYSSHLMTDYRQGWQLKSLSVQEREYAVEIAIIGAFTGLSEVAFTIQVQADGTITTRYTLNNLPKEIIREIGIAYCLENTVDSLSWQRQGYWSAYPAGHLSATAGTVALFDNRLKTYRNAPEKDWQFDSKSFFYHGVENESADALSFIARATKENILTYKLHMKNGGHIVVHGTGTEGCRLDRHDDSLYLFINNALDYPDLGWGNYQRNIVPGNSYSGQVRISVHVPTW